MRLSRKVHEDPPLGNFGRGFNDAVEPLVAIDDNRRGKARVEAKQRAVRLVGVEAEEWDVTVDELLGEDTCDDGLADTALFAADEVKPRHVVSMLAHSHHRLVRKHQRVISLRSTAFDSPSPSDSVDALAFISVRKSGSLASPSSR